MRWAWLGLLLVRLAATANLYEILGVSRGATDKEIKQAFHKMALLWHPDRNPDEKAERTFQLVNRAHEVLSDPKTRNRFDRGENVDAKH